MLSWLTRRTRTPQPFTPPFDVVVDLAPGSVPLGMEPEAAMTAAAAAIQLLPGAGRVRVRLSGPGLPSTLRLFPAGRSTERPGEPWARLRKAATEAMGAALVPPAAPEPVPLQSAPFRTAGGFAEAPAHFDALAALADLAQSVRQPQPQPKPSTRAAPSLEGDIAALARLLGFVLPHMDWATAGAAVHRFGSYAAVLAAPETELRKVNGLGTHSVAAIKLVHEAAVRLARAGLSGQPVLDDPERLDAYLAAALARERIEQFRILFLDEQGMLKADEVQATGTVNHTPVYPREVVRRALELRAAAIVLVHNHPSGDPAPSVDDIDMTAEIGRAAEALGVELRDHIIVGNGRTLSFKDAGLL